MTEVYSPRLRAIADDAAREHRAADRARRLHRRARSELRDAGGDSRVPHARRRRGRHVHGARSDRRAAHGHRGARHLVHHQHGGRRAAGAAASRRSDGDGAAGAAGSSSRCWRASLAGSDALVAAARAAREHAVADYSRLQGRRRARDRRRRDHHRLQHRERDLRPDDLRRARGDVQGAVGRPPRRSAASPSSPTPPTPTPPCGACRQIIWEFCRRHRSRSSPISTRSRRTHRMQRPAAAAVRQAIARLQPTGSRCISRSTQRPSTNPSPTCQLDPILITRMLPTIAWQDDDIVMVDQRKLPAAEVYVRCKTANDVAKAIKTMVIRGAPAIGVARGDGPRARRGAQQGDRHASSSPPSFRRPAICWPRRGRPRSTCSGRSSG